MTATQQLADRYISLPNVFMMFFVSYMAHKFNMQHILPLIVVMYATMLQFCLPMYRGIKELYEYHNYHDPKNIHNRFLLATAYFNKKDILSSWDVTRVGLVHNPRDFKLNLNAAYCCRAMGDRQAALHYITVAENNIYQGQEPAVVEIIKTFKKTLQGVDVDTEYELIKQKKSKLSKTDRDKIIELKSKQSKEQKA
jgi:hypothetical protein